MSKASRSKWFVDWCLKNGHAAAVRRDTAIRRRRNKRIQNWGKDTTPDTHTNDKRSYYRGVYLKTEHWRTLRREKLKQNPACEKCGAKYLVDVHHLRYKSLYDVELSDLQSLCRGCHNKEHGKAIPT